MGGAKGRVGELPVLLHSPGVFGVLAVHSLPAGPGGAIG